MKLIVTAVIWIIIGVIPATATFPGKNGRIAFVQGGEIFTMNPDGSGIRQLTHLTPDNSANWPAWSADGRQIVFNEFPDRKAAIWVMGADGSNQHLVFAEDHFDENRPSFSPDGSRVVFGRCNRLLGDGDTCAIYTVGVNGASLQPVTRFVRDTTARSPMFSPDGTRIAFILSNDTAAGFLGVTYVIDADGSNMRRITEPGPCLIRPDWSPDNTRITLFSHFCNPQNETIAVMDADGRNLRYVTNNGTDYFNGPHDRNPAFSPDGKFIVFERSPPDLNGSAIYVMQIDGTQLKALAILPRSQRTPRQSVHARNKRLTRVEEGGAVPRWGVAPE